MTRPKLLQFSFLPYTSLEKELKIGDVLFWPFYRKKDRYIKDVPIRNQIEKFLKQYVEHAKQKKSLEKITMVSYRSPNNLKPLSRKPAKEVKNIVTMLCFCTLVRNTRWRAFSSDDFQLIHQNFIPGDDGIAPSSGSWIQRQTGGLKIDEVVFITPFHICTGESIDFNEKILKALEKLQQDEDNSDFYRRIITALEWVAYAYTNVDNFNYFSRIVMMSTAFEILLDGFQGKFAFMGKVKNLTCNTLDDTPKKRATREISYQGKKAEKSFSYKEWWAYDFYELRNKIVHGEEINTKDAKNRKGEFHFQIAMLFFEECLKKILSDKGYYPYDDFRDGIIWAGIYDYI